MALTWTAKAPGDVYRYTWTPALADGDSLASYTVSATGATIDSQTIDGDSVVLFVSGGSAGTTASFAFSGVTSDGETLTETIYLPIVASTATGPTAATICAFALRKITGIGETPDAAQEADALERLNDMLQAWKATGADVGATFPLLTSTTLKLPDSYLSAIKHNLVLQLADLYGAEISPVTAQNARLGLQLIKQANLPETRAGADYY